MMSMKKDWFNAWRKQESSKVVQCLLGMINNVGKFIPNLAEITKPLRELLNKEIDWQWNTWRSSEQNKRITDTKKLLSIFLPIKNNTDDASKSGIRAVLMQNGKPVSYVSRSVANAQKNYAIINQEGTFSSSIWMSKISSICVWKWGCNHLRP